MKIRLYWNQLSALILMGAFGQAHAAVFEFGIYGIGLRNGTNVYSDYQSYGVGTIEIEDSALVPNGFIDMKSTAFRRFKLDFTGVEGTYSFTFGPNVIDQDFLRDSIAPTQAGITLNANGLPQRFDSPQYSTSNSQGFYNTSNGAFPGSQTQFFGWWDDDGFSNPVKVLLEDTEIQGVMRHRGDILSAADLLALPNNIILGEINGQWIFEAPNFGSNELDFNGFYTFDQKVIHPAVPLPAADCLFNWAETNYAELFSPAGAATQTLPPYTYRYYKNTNAYVGISSANNDVYYLGPDGNLLDVGNLSAWLAKAKCQ